MDKLLKIAVIIGWIAVAIALLSKLNIDGEHLYLEEVQACETAEVPNAEPKPTLTSAPKYTITFLYHGDDVVICEDEDEQFPTRDEIYCLSKVVHGEASICDTLTKTGVIWTVLNRVDADNYPNTIREVITQEKQFHGFWRECDTPVTVEEWRLCYEIVKAWKNGDDRFRTLPSNYLYFRGDGSHNYFTTYQTKSLKEAQKNAWRWDMESVYGKEK